MLTDNVSKIKKSVLPNITFILKVLEKMGLFVAECAYFQNFKK